MAFRKKYEKVMNLNPDLLVIQEAENDTKLAKHLSSLNYNQLIWYGNNPNKGVAILSFNKLEIALNPNHNPDFEYIIPIKLKANKKEINLFAIWAMPHKTENKKSYVGQIWGAINYYKKDLSKNLWTNKTTCEIGKYKDWIKLSDHMPIIIENLKI